VTIVTPAAKKAFEIFDVDKSGSISAEELVKILTRDTPAGKPLGLADAKEIIGDFDRRGVGELNLEDFAACWAIIGGGSSVTALENHSIYWKAIEAPGVKAEITRIFKKLDVSGDGSLERDELQEVVAFYQGAEFDADEFFGYWDVQGADEAHVGTLHIDDHKSGDIDEREFGWYIADCAGLADYGDGDGYDDIARGHLMKTTLTAFEDAIDEINRRNKHRKSLVVQNDMRVMYQMTLAGHRTQVGDLFNMCDEDKSNSLDFGELKDIIIELTGRSSFSEDKLMEFFKGKNVGDTINQMEFGWFLADHAGQNEKMPALIEKMKDAIQKVHERYVLEGKRK